MWALPPGIVKLPRSGCVWNIFSRKTGVRVGYTLCTVPSVKIYATREWSCDYVSLYRASTRGIRRPATNVNYLLVISTPDGRKSIVHVCVRWATTLLGNSSACPTKRKKRQVITKTPTYHLDYSRYQRFVVYPSNGKLDGLNFSGSHAQWRSQEGGIRG